MKPLGQASLFSIAVAFILGVTFIKASTPVWVTVVLGLAIVTASFFIFLYKPKAKTIAQARRAAEGLVPGTLPWAEALHKQGFISDEELEGFKRSLQS